MPAETVQCIRPMPSWTGRSDVRPKRYDRVASAMFKRQPEANDRLAVKTDDTITVQGQVFPVHRVMLALVSTVFDAAFQCDLEEGAQHCSPWIFCESVTSTGRQWSLAVAAVIRSSTGCIPIVSHCDLTDSCIHAPC